MQPIPFVDVKPRERALKAAIDQAISRVVDSGWFIHGPELERFEQRLAHHEEVDHCVGVGSGLDALFFLLQAHDVGPGAEVIVPSNTYIATWLAVSHCGATPIPVEPDLRTYNITAEAAAAAITPRTAAIMPVHLYGRPVDMQAFEDLAARHGLLLLADAAQSLGATLQRRRVSSYGHGAATSFYPTKNLGAMGDGGAVLTNDAAIADKVRALRNYGSVRKYENPQDGWNSRLDEIQAAILTEKLDYLDSWNARRRELAQHYSAVLGEGFDLPPTSSEEIQSASHLYVIGVDDRDAITEALEAKRIGFGIHYPTPPHRQGVYRSMNNIALPIADRLAARVLSLPMSPSLTVDDADDVAAVVRKAASPSAQFA